MRNSYKKRFHGDRSKFIFDDLVIKKNNSLLFDLY